MELYFELAGDVVIVKIVGFNVTFATSQVELTQFYPIEALRLSKTGMLREHPDLKGMSEWDMKLETIKRLKEHIKKLKTEDKIKDYIIEELSKQGYSIKMIKRKGFRPQKVK